MLGRSVSLELGQRVPLCDLEPQRVTLHLPRRNVVQLELQSQLVTLHLSAQRVAMHVDDFVAETVAIIMHGGEQVTVRGVVVTHEITGTGVMEIEDLGYEIARSLDSIVESQNSVFTRALSTPPAVPALDSRYIVGTSPTGAWAGYESAIATYDKQTLEWRFRVPTEGVTLWVDDEDKLCTWNGQAWVSSGGSAAGHAVYRADETMSALRVVRLSGPNRVVRAQLPDVEALAPVGLTIQAVDAGDAVEVVIDGPVSDASWNWQVGMPVSLGPDGVLTQALPEDFEFAVDIGMPITPTTIVVRISPPIRL